MTPSPEQLTTIATLQLKLSSLKIDGHFLPEVTEGPIVSLYRFKPTGATRLSQVEGLSKDMAIALGVETVQIASLPRENAIGIYVPNKSKKDLPFKSTVEYVWNAAASGTIKVPICLGMGTQGDILVEDLTLLPHLLIAGSTGSGKSTLLNSILASFCYCVPPSKLRLVLCDTKQVEFTLFERAPHLLLPVAKDVPSVVDSLEDLCHLIDQRLTLMAQRGVQNILQYNERNQHKQMEYIVLVIDELAEPLQDQRKESDEKGAKSYGKLAEYKLGRITSKARATGIYVIAATQRTSVKVVEGNIKANFPARVSFRLPSDFDSRTILGRSGAESLLARGDILFLNPNSPEVRRIHAPLAEQRDIEAAIEMAISRS